MIGNAKAWRTVRMVSIISNNSYLNVEEGPQFLEPGRKAKFVYTIEYRPFTSFDQNLAIATSRLVVL